MRKGHYIESGDAEQLNVEFAKLRDIKFEYNSAVIKEESFGNLDYIIAMLKLEQGFTLRIDAHTCSQGTHDYNMDLSNRRAASVLQYFVSKGLDKTRFDVEGHAETMPIATNTTEEGKALNRRVEFTIIFEPKITENDKF
ncbi:MAG: OmpA family protein [Flavobacteriales bacterium]